MKRKKVIPKTKQEIETRIRRRKTSSIVVLVIVCAFSLLGLGYLLIMPIPVLLMQTVTLSSYSSVTRWFTNARVVTTSIYGNCYSPWYSPGYCLTTVPLNSPITSIASYTAIFEYTSTVGVNTLSLYALSQAGSIVLVIIAIVAVGVTLSYFGRSDSPTMTEVFAKATVMGWLKASTKYRLKTFLKGLAAFLFGLLITSPCTYEIGGQGRYSCLLFWFYHVGSDLSYLPESPLSNITRGIGGYLLLPAALAIPSGILFMYRGLKPVKHEMHVCSTCHDETEQFFTDVKYREGFEVKKTWQGFVTTKEEELLKNVDGFWYICENCGGMNLVDKFCRKCGAEMQVGKLSCSKCGAEFKELGSRKGYKRETPDRLQEKNNAAKTSQEVRTHSDQPTITIRQPVIKVRRKTPTLILLTVICVVPLLGLAYSLFTPFIPITIYQTMTFNTASSVTRTFTFSIANPTSYTSLFCALICATTVRVLSYVPTTSTVAYTAFSSSSSTSYGFSTQSPYALSQGGSIVLMTVTIILVGAALFYFGRTRQISHDVIPPSQLSNQATEPTKDTVKPTVKFCRECGAKMPRDSRFCEKCGQNVQPI